MKINYLPSTSHWIVPPIVLGILAFLMCIMLIQKIVECKKQNKKIFNYREYKFFQENWDKVKLIGSLVLFISYISLIDKLGFLVSSIIFITLFNVLFAGFKSGYKSLLNSLIISSLFSVGIWFLFGQVFRITLP